MKGSVGKKGRIRIREGRRRKVKEVVKR